LAVIWGTAKFRQWVCTRAIRDHVGRHAMS
jgi:hypothetical protein